jgi:hypothetical protein
MTLTVFSSCLSLLVLTGCGCAGVGLDRVRPTDAIIAVGQTITLEYQTGGYCHGSSPTESDYVTVPTHWTTKDTLIVALDTLTGRVSGRAIGDANVTMATRGYLVAIHVR